MKICHFVLEISMWLKSGYKLVSLQGSRTEEKRYPSSSASCAGSSSTDVAGAPPLHCRLDPYTAEITGSDAISRTFTNDQVNENYILVVC